MKTLTLSLVAAFGVLLITASSAQARPLNPAVGLGPNKLTIQPKYRRCVVTYYGRGLKCFRSYSIAYRYRHIYQNLGGKARLIKRHGRYCVYFYVPKQRKAFRSYASAKRYAQFLQSLGLKTSIRCYPILRPLPVPSVPALEKTPRLPIPDPGPKKPVLR